MREEWLCGCAAVRLCGCAAVRGEAEAVPTHTAMLDGGLAILTRAARTRAKGYTH